LTKNQWPEMRFPCLS